MIDMNMKSA